MKRERFIQGSWKKVDFPNKGILHIEDEKVVVKNVLPGTDRGGGRYQAENGKV